MSRRFALAAAALTMLAALALVAPAQAGGEEEEEYAAMLPPEVLAFIDRTEACLHWGGEEPYDEARKAEIEAAWKDLRCDDLKADHAEMRRRYANSKALEAIDALPMDQF
jgi:hypothetical protein